MGKSLLGSMGVFTPHSRAWLFSEHDSKKYPKVDTHVHVWDLEWFRYPWLKNKEKLNRTFSFSEYEHETKKAAIQKILFVECGAAPEHALGEVDWAIAWGVDFPLIHGVIGQADMSEMAYFPSHLEVLQERHQVKGIRIPFDAALANPLPFIKNMHLLARSGLCLDLLLSPKQLIPAAKLLARCPAMPCILDHMGGPDIQGGEFDNWAKGITELAALPHVSCKISGLLTLAGPDWTLEQLRPYVEFVINSFGFDRIMYGGDWPVVLQIGRYLDWSRVFDELIKPYSKDEQLKCCQGNAERIYRI